MEKLERLAEIEGYSTPDDMLAELITESVVPGICKNRDCDYSCEVEPDQQEGWCEECNAGTVVSCMVLAGII